ncbi:MAG TPA: bacteriohopanetetrol glucosamine biosynthesis glycosyltransferase HpnI [Acetobacteraceae bacterium]|nr:bacteriohopanetetrol glucosamine biosynthesis glycosyltransferase HpnI [Acetobacteraceae bacterium]
MGVLAAILGLIAVAGFLDTLAGLWLVHRFVHRAPPAPGRRPPISVLKPLAGDEPLLEEALASLCLQDYPDLQLVCGAADPSDPGLAVARRLAARFPERDITVVSDPGPPGANRKVANLIAMLPAARHGILVISDADVHAPPGYLDAIAAALESPGTGLATTLYTGRPGVPGWPARFGAAGITHGFLPAALLGRALGRQDALGATLALPRDVLARAGGLEALLDELADDAVLGRRVAALGLAVRLAPTIPATTVPERSLGALFRHELRWARTFRSLAPSGYAASALRYPIPWTLLAIAASAAAPWSLFLFLLAWAVRAFAARAIDRALRLPPVLPSWLIPLRDIFSLAVLLVSYTGERVEWRGAVLRAGRPGSGTSSRAPKKGIPGR